MEKIKDLSISVYREGSKRKECGLYVTNKQWNRKDKLGMLISPVSKRMMGLAVNLKGSISGNTFLVQKEMTP